MAVERRQGVTELERRIEKVESAIFDEGGIFSQLAVIKSNQSDSRTAAEERHREVLRAVQSSQPGAKPVTKMFGITPGTAYEVTKLLGVLATIAGTIWATRADSTAAVAEELKATTRQVEQIVEDAKDKE